MNISETKWRRTADRKEERDVEEMTEEGSLFQMGTVWQRKDDKWRDDEADGKRKEWGKRVDRSAQGTSEACNAGGPFPIEKLPKKAKAVFSPSPRQSGETSLLESRHVLQGRIPDDRSCHSELDFLYIL